MLQWHDKLIALRIWEVTGDFTIISNNAADAPQLTYVLVLVTRFRVSQIILGQVKVDPAVVSFVRSMIRSTLLQCRRQERVRKKPSHKLDPKRSGVYFAQIPPYLTREVRGTILSIGLCFRWHRTRGPFMNGPTTDSQTGTAFVCA